MKDSSVTSCPLNLSRGLGLVTGASTIGAFALGVGSSDLAAAEPAASVDRVHLVFTVSAALVVLASLVAGLIVSLVTWNASLEGG